MNWYSEVQLLWSESFSWNTVCAKDLAPSGKPSTDIRVGPIVINPLTADGVYRRHGEWRRTTDDVYRRHLTYRRFSPSVAHSASSRFLQPFGNYSLHVWVQVQCKFATAFPQSERKRVEAWVGSCSQLRDARRPGQSDRRSIGNQLPDDDSGDQWLIGVFDSDVGYSGRQNRDLEWPWPKQRPCKSSTMCDHRSAIGHRRSAVAENVDNLRDKFGGAQDTREEEIDQSEGFDGESQRVSRSISKENRSKDRNPQVWFFLILPSVAGRQTPQRSRG